MSTSFVVGNPKKTITPKCTQAHLLLPCADFGQLLVADVHEHHTAVLASADQQAVVIAHMQSGNGALMALDLIELPCTHINEWLLALLLNC
jgi:hypothetical protein